MPAEPIVLDAPAGALRLTFREGAAPTLSVTLGDAAVLAPSPLAFSLDGLDVMKDVAAGTPDRFAIDETYPWRGAKSLAVNRGNGARVPLTHRATGLAFFLDLRAFDSGAAFRFCVPPVSGGRPPGAGPRVPDEATRFILPAGSTVWTHDLENHYEGVHRSRNVAHLREGEWAAPPVTCKLPDGAGYASITEAALVNYAGMALVGDGLSGFRLVLGHAHPVSYPFRLRYAEHVERLKQPAAVDGAVTTPWRVVLAGRDLDAIVNSDVIHSLCDPPDPALFADGPHSDWIRPGRAVWRYLDGGERTLEGMKEFSRLASKLGFEHHVVEGFWREWSDDQLRDLTSYSRKRGVGIWLWKHSRDLRTPEALSAFLDYCVAVGATGAKVDFFDHEAKEVVDHYREVLREAAKRRLLVCFHGSNKPTGEARTFPNELNRESIHGMEYRRTKVKARHNATLPFTRFLAGHGDYTPVHFGERLGDTTWAHQIATAVVFLHPLLTYAAHPATLLDHPCADLIRSIPSTWDETVVLPISEIGQIAVFARRSDDAWFLGVLNGTGPCTIRVPLSFLGPGAYETLCVRDRPASPASVDIAKESHRRGDVLSLALSSGGGFLARFVQRA